MNIYLLSDLHLEFHRDGGRGFLAALDPRGVDVLVLAGDITNGHLLTDTLSHFCSRFPQVIYVSGNHELYGFHAQSIITSPLLRPTSLPLSPTILPMYNLHILDRHHTVTLDGVRFVGSTLWFPKPPCGAPKADYNDFHWIQGFEPWVYEEHRATAAFLDATLQPNDILVTHFFPLRESISVEYQNHPLNCFFWSGAEVDRIVRERSPRLALHGHTHTSFDYHIGRTHVVCNPFGYVGTSDQNRLFTRKILTVAT